MDASWISEEHTDSRAGYCLRLAPLDKDGPSAAYLVFSKVMKKVCLSTEHAEMMAISECIREIIRQRNFLHELGAPQQVPTFIGEDNSGTVTYAHSEKLGDRSKHLHVLMRHNKEEQRDGLIDVVKVHTTVQWADMDTKTLEPEVYLRQKKVRLGQRESSNHRTSL